MLLLLVPALVAIQTPQTPELDLTFAPLRRAVDAQGERVVSGDIDGDGDSDVIFLDGGASILRNRGDGVFQVASRLPNDPLVTGAGALEDFDGDGDLDVVRRVTSGLQLLMNDGTGRFSEATPALFDGQPMLQKALDLEGDGDIDLLLIDRVLVNFGGLVFQEIPLGAPAGQGAVADVDGDGDLDLFGVGGSLLLYLQGPALTFTDASGQLPTGSGVVAAAGDVDGDGDVDFVFGSASGSKRVLLNDGSGVFTELLGAFPIVPDQTSSLTLVDLDADGQLELLKTTSVTGDPYFPFFASNELFENDGSGFFQPAPARLEARGLSVSVAVEDFDGNGTPDLFFPSSPRALLALNDGAGGFVFDDDGMPFSQQATARVAVGDLNLDGILDLAVPRNQQNVFEQARGAVLFGIGNGEFTEVALPFPEERGRTTSAALGDVQGDGILDVFVTREIEGPSAQDNLLFSNDGAGNLTDATHLLVDHSPEHRGYFREAAFFDLDGDGDQDLGYTGVDDNDGQGGGLCLYRNNGGVFEDLSPTIDSFGPGLGPLRVADVEGDGDLDVVTAGSQVSGTLPFTGGVLLYENQGTGQFALVSSSLPSGPGSTTHARWIDVGDVDQDGDPDVVCELSSAGLRQNIFSRNNGSGTFTNLVGHVPQVLVDSSGSAYQLSDLDQDGDLDLCGRDAYLEFVGPAFRWRPVLTDVAGAHADFDRDGDVDVFVPRSGTDELRFGLGRQLARRGLPRIGRGLRLELYGPEQEPWILAVSTARVSVPTSSGLLQLHPAGLSVSNFGSIAASGLTRLTVPVPNDPSLTGRTLYWQALLGTSLRLSNLELTTFSDF